MLLGLKDLMDEVMDDNDVKYDVRKKYADKFKNLLIDKDEIF